jgi:hypothetical protein
MCAAILIVHVIVPYNFCIRPQAHMPQVIKMVSITKYRIHGEFTF